MSLVLWLWFMIPIRHQSGSILIVKRFQHGQRNKWPLGNNVSRHGNARPDYVWLDRLTQEAEAAGSQWFTSVHREALMKQLDFRRPSEWFGVARALRPRRIFCHVGPTNSGKTHAAIQRLRETKSGVYCAPLRLLAMEMWEKLNQAGRDCALRTGEITSGPMKDPEGDFRSASILACTVEMLDLDREFEVAVIDEIQMFADAQRGWAFTQALLGVKAREIYLCGEEAALPLIKKMAAEAGDEVHISRYERLSPLSIGEESLKDDLKNLRQGDCVVCFSRKKIFEMKQLIESKLEGVKCAVVYGNLPMENRLVQARKFNERVDGHTILVASDAIGMGLNLNIQRIVFQSVMQMSPDGFVHVPPSRIKQIAGRAGRFGFGNDGSATCLVDRDMDYFQDCMNFPNEEYSNAGLAPLAKQIEELAWQFPSLPLVALLSAITDAGRYSSQYSPCISKEQKILAHVLEDYPSLPIADKLVLVAAPVNLRDLSLLSSYRWFVSSLEAGRPCELQVHLRDRGNVMNYLELAESFYRMLDLYLWLGVRFPETFYQREEALKKRQTCNELVARLLQQITFDNRSNDKSTPILDTIKSSSLAGRGAFDRILDEMNKHVKSS